MFVNKHDSVYLFVTVKVKVEGQNCRTENLSIVIAWLWFKIFFTQIWQSDRYLTNRSKFVMKYD